MSDEEQLMADDESESTASEPEVEPLEVEPLPIEPLPVVEPEPLPVIEPQLQADELSDLFEVPQPEDNDFYIDDLFELDGDDDLSDLTSVSNEDVMGPPPRVVKRKTTPRVRRASRRYAPPPSVRGIQ